MARKQEKISRLILNYLRKNPDAGDTLEGITKWWLGLEKIDLSVNEVSNILESLTQKGLIRKCRTKGGTTFYKVGEEKKSQKSKPGVYVEEVPCNVRTIEGVDTSTAAFIGLAEKGDLDKAVLVTNFSEFEEKYGSFYVKSDGTIHSYLAYSVFQFFNNGGRRCYVVRVAHGTLDDYITGFSLLDIVHDVSIIAVPGVGSKEIVDYGSAYCEKRSILIGMNDCFFIGEMKATDDTVEKAQTFVNGLAKKGPNAAVYFPWLTIVDPTNNSLIREIPPSGAIAGIYARSDEQHGVWMAPAGKEANIIGATGLIKNVDDVELDFLDNTCINCVRGIPAVGIVIWGSRTLSAQPEWKYIPVKRLKIFLEGSLSKGTKWAVFEPNDEPLWAKIRSSVGAFMHGLFRKGAFQGATPREAYFVKCDKETMTQDDINEGIINIIVGFAPLKPAEFVIIKIHQKAS